ncbi:ribose 5-phosphate isomerase B [Candidatus Saganbacteria bacterium]|uniref:Ribose 5-phosphate isomerase B n=1 Tax=Candidatus Saganbacteria bacterium TaxID=2575572 RepID=A0A9D6ULI9_UNCSA|nr:ribose 5-phosphate isomerase B [Candidatus Saganbacteria bacterium]
MRIAIGSDHAGFKMKDQIGDYLKKKKIVFKDFGTFSEKSCDYPDYAFLVAAVVAAGKFDRGILICGSGVGMAVAANRVKGIRAVNVNNLYTARQSRKHGNANVLCLAGKKISRKKALKILEVWLNTPFSEGERHQRRIEKLDRLR